MGKNWNEISDDEILNFEGAQTGEMARYERIMQHKTILALNNAKDQLNGLMQTIYRFSQGLQDTINSSTKEMKSSTDQLISLYDKVSQDQGKQQKVLVALSIVVSLSTAIYTAITWQSVTAMNEANSIQRQFLDLEKAKLSKQEGTRIGIIKRIFPRLQKYPHREFWN